MPAADGDFANPASPQPVIRTADDPAAETILAFLGIRIPGDVHGAWALHWQAGRRSIFRAVNVERKAGGLTTPYGPGGLDQALVLIDGHGGGRWYNFHEGSSRGQGRNYRHLLIQNTVEPLAIYQCNPEHARSDANLEVRNARHVSIYGLKGEYNETILWVRDSDHVFVFGYGGNASAFPGASLFRIERTPNFLLANLYDSPRLNAGSPTNFAGAAVDPRRWHMVEERAPDGEILRMAPLDRPVLYRRGRPAEAETGSKN